MNDVQQILHHASRLTFILRDSSQDDLRAAETALCDFIESWVKTGEGACLPDDPKDESCLSDVDVMDCVLEAVRMRIEE